MGPEIARSTDFNQDSHPICAKLKSQRGFSIPEALIASAVIIMSVLGVSNSVFNLGKNSAKNRMVASAFAIETLIVSTTQNSEYLRTQTIYGGGQSIADALSSGGAPPRIQLKDDTGTVIADTGSPVTFNNEGKTCTGFPSRTCTIQVNFSIANTGSPTAPDYRFAYYIEFAQVKDVEATQPMGMRSGTTFQAADYQTPINYMFFERAAGTLQCDPNQADSVIITGMDRDTGMLSCAKFPSSPLAQGQISKGITYSAGSQELQVKGVTAKKYVCPSNYALVSVNMRDLDPTATPGVAPKCRFAGPTSYSFNYTQGYHGGSLVPCPPFYTVDTASSNCTGSASVTRPAACNPATRPAWNGSSVAQVTDPGPPNTSQGPSGGWDWATKTIGTKRMDCTVKYNPQYCNIEISTTVNFSVTCKRDPAIPDEVTATLQ